MVDARDHRRSALTTFSVSQRSMQPNDRGHRGHNQPGPNENLDDRATGRDGLSPDLMCPVDAPLPIRELSLEPSLLLRWIKRPAGGTVEQPASTQLGHDVGSAAAGVAVN